MKTTSVNLTRQYLLALGVIAALSITTFIFLRIAISAQSTSAAEVNVAGRQRMLSQRISRFALLYVTSTDAQQQEELKKTLINDLALFEESHQGLINGGQVRGLSSDEVLVLPGSPSPEAHSIYFEEPLKLDQQVTTFIAEARALLDQPRAELTLKNPHLQYLLKAAASDILSALNKVTGQYQVESENAIKRLQNFEAGVLGITLIVLALTGFLIFRPMVAQITRHTQELEENYKLREGQTVQLEERTKALASVAEVSTATSTILDAHALLQRVVDLAKERFDLYHSHIYLLNDAGDTLVLSSGAGNVGRQMVAEGRSIPLDREQSLVARAAREKKGVTVNDVTQAPDFLPNPLLPDTRSEMAVPMMVGDQVVGIFDVQSELVGRFTEADIAIQTTLAAQVASAVQNARSYTEIQRSQAQLAEALNISRLANWEYDFYQDIFTFNDHFYSIFRTTVEKVGGYKISSADYARNFVHPEDAVLVGAEIQRAIESKERHYAAALEHRIIFENGEIGYISVKVNVDRDENGKIIRWYGANQDVTERRRLEEQNRKHAIQQEAINLITQKIQSTTTIESALQIAARELGHALGKRQTLVTLESPTFEGSGVPVEPEQK